MREISMPRYIDSQYQIFFWEIDELVPIFALLAIGILSNTLTWMFLAVYFVGRAFQRFKYSRLEGVLLHMAFWRGWIGLNRRFENGFEREFDV